MRALCLTLLVASGCIDVGSLSAHYVDMAGDAGRPTMCETVSKPVTVSTPVAPNSYDVVPVAAFDDSRAWFAIATNKTGFVGVYETNDPTTAPTQLTSFSSSSQGQLTLPRLTSRGPNETDAFLTFVDSNFGTLTVDTITATQVSPAPQSSFCTSGLPLTVDIARSGESWLVPVGCADTFAIDNSGATQTPPRLSANPIEVHLVKDTDANTTYIVGATTTPFVIPVTIIPPSSGPAQNIDAAFTLTNIGAALAPTGSNMLIAGISDGQLAIVLYDPVAQMIVKQTQSSSATVAPDHQITVGVAAGSDNFVVVYGSKGGGVAGVSIDPTSGAGLPFSISDTGANPQVAYVGGTFVVTYVDTSAKLIEIRCP